MNAENNESIYIVPKGFNVDKWFLEILLPLSIGAKWTYVILAVCACGDDSAWPSMSYLMRQTHSSQRTVQRYLQELIRNGFITRSYEFYIGQKRVIYRFLNHAVLSARKTGETDRQGNFISGEERSRKTLSNAKKHGGCNADWNLDDWEKDIDQSEKLQAEYKAECQEVYPRMQAHRRI